MKKYLFSLIILLSFISIKPNAQDLSLDFLQGGFQQITGIEQVGDSRIFVLQQNGLIRVWDDSIYTFLDVSDSISTGGERGLLGLAFHPNFSTNGFLFVNYTDPSGDTKVERYNLMEADQMRADPSSGVELLSINQPFSNHNGGDLNFGADGYLYIATGDGGSGGDPQNNSQNTTNLLGKILRIDVNNGNPYSIPADNPFVNDNNVEDEIWSLGLRNPWRFAFDSETNDMWIADVGQNAWEEVSFQPAGSPGGENYGWRCYEGDVEFNTNGCGPISEYTFPIFVYPHNSSGGFSITGGEVYRGNSYPNFLGKYLFADFSTGNFWSAQITDNFVADTSVEFLGNMGISPSAFGTDANGEMLVADYGGTLFRIIDDSQLPLQITSFDLIQNQNTVLLKWTSVAEYEVDHYLPQWSENGIDFSDLGKVEKTHSGNEQSHYTFNSLAKDGINFYRIKQINKDGSADFTEIKSLRIELGNDMIIIPNPVGETAWIRNIPKDIRSVRLTIYNSQQKIIVEKSVRVDNSSLSLDEIISNLTTGFYYVELNGTGFRSTVPLVKM